MELDLHGFPTFASLFPYVFYAFYSLLIVSFFTVLTFDLNLSVYLSCAIRFFPIWFVSFWSLFPFPSSPYVFPFHFFSSLHFFGITFIFSVSARFFSFLTQFITILSLLSFTSTFCFATSLPLTFIFSFLSYRISSRLSFTSISLSFLHSSSFFTISLLFTPSFLLPTLSRASSSLRPFSPFTFTHSLYCIPPLLSLFTSSSPHHPSLFSFLNLYVISFISPSLHPQQHYFLPIYRFHKQSIKTHLLAPSPFVYLYTPSLSRSLPPLWSSIYSLYPTLSLFSISFFFTFVRLLSPLSSSFVSFYHPPTF